MSEFRALFERCGWSIPEAAGRLGYSEGSIYRWLRDEVQPKNLILNVLRTELDRRAETETSAGFRFIDLFAGIGGLRIGFEGIGGKCVFTSEWDRFAQETYRKNFLDGTDHMLAGDIREFTKSPETLGQIPEHDVLLAGFPCQPFSIAGVSKKNALGRPHGFLCDTQGTLFFDLAQIINHHRPSAFLLENVKNLERHDGGKTFATIQQVLREELGYETVTHRVISSEPWVPQRRERVFIVGFREGCEFSFDDLVVPDTPHPTLGSVLETEVPEKYTLTPKLWDYLQRYKEKHAAKGNGFGCSVFGPGDVTRTLSARYYKDGSEVLVDQGRGQRPRRLTPRECACLMGFERGDRKWQIPVSDTQAYRQFGNAVVVPAVEAVAKAMAPYITKAVSGTARISEKEPSELKLAS